MKHGIWQILYVKQMLWKKVRDLKWKYNFMFFLIIEQTNKRSPSANIDTKEEPIPKKQKKSPLETNTLPVIRVQKS